jgi:predicted DNA-binding transcriptional regulator YafY
MNKIISEAITNRRIILFLYTDDEGNIHKRIAEPYAYGVTKQGNEAVRCYQIGGSSETEIPGWRLFLVDRITDLIITDETFEGCAPGYAQGDKGLNPIYCRIP